MGEEGADARAGGGEQGLTGGGHWTLVTGHDQDDQVRMGDEKTPNQECSPAKYACEWLLISLQMRDPMVPDSQVVSKGAKQSYRRQC